MMPEKNPLNWSLAMWILPIGAGLIGGIVSVFNKLATKKITKSNSIEIISEILTSGFVSLISFMVMNSLDVDMGLCAAASGVCGHMATRLLFKIENIIDKKIDEYGDS